MDMNSDLEFMVQTDMIERGLNPYDPIDVKTYWEEQLNDN
jgi:hypothetical protein